MINKTTMRRYVNHFIDISAINKNSVIVDAGACRGAFIELLKNDTAVRNENIYAIEPCHGNCDLFLKNVPYSLFRGALVGADFVGNSISFREFVGLPEWGNSFEIGADTKHPKLQEFRIYDVPVLRANNLFSHFNISHVDFLKLDIYGSEKQILKTMSVDMAEKVYQVSMEVYLKQWSLKAAENQLISMGFKTIVDTNKNEVYGTRL